MSSGADGKDQSIPTQHETDIIILGGGPAGIAAGIQLRRHGFNPLILDRDSPGGLLQEANFVENYPGFPEGIIGVDLAAMMNSHLDAAGVRILTNVDITSVDHSDGRFILETSDDPGAHSSRILLIATGTVPNPQPIPATADNWGRVRSGVKDLMTREIHDCTIAIVGGGDAAFDYSLSLTRHNDVRNNSIHIMNRSSKTKCLPLLQERAMSRELISYHPDTSIMCMTSTEPSLRLLLQSSDRTWELEAHYLIYAIGRRPNLDFLSDSLRKRLNELREEGLLYLVGDVGNGIHRQAAIAVGQGIDAAMRIANIFPESPE